MRLTILFLLVAGLACGDLTPDPGRPEPHATLWSRVPQDKAGEMFARQGEAPYPCAEWVRGYVGLMQPGDSAIVRQDPSEPPLEFCVPRGVTLVLDSTSHRQPAVLHPPTPR